MIVGVAVRVKVAGSVGEMDGVAVKVGGSLGAAGVAVGIRGTSDGVRLVGCSTTTAVNGIGVGKAGRLIKADAS